jgi:hypothetical protein
MAGLFGSKSDISPILLASKAALGVAKAMALPGPHGPKEKVKTKLTSTTIQDILKIFLIFLPPFLISMSYKWDSSTSAIFLEFHPFRQVPGAATF